MPQPPSVADPQGAPAADGADARPPKRRRWGRLLWRIARTLALAYVGIVIVVYFLQSKFVYFPKARLEQTPAALNMPYEDVWLTASDGVKLHAWFVPADPSRATVLFCHGNGGNISHRVETLRLLHQLQLSVLIFDYRGYGQSEGKPSEPGTYRDAQAAWRYLTATRAIPPGRIVVQGRSLGGAIAAHLAAEHAPAALIVESSFTSAPDLAGEIFWFLPARWLCRFDYPTAKCVRQAGCPVLVVHSADDEMIRYHHGQRIFEAAREPKQFLQLAGSHNGAFFESVQTYLNGLDAFLAAHVDAAAGD